MPNVLCLEIYACLRTVLYQITVGAEECSFCYTGHERMFVVVYFALKDFNQHWRFIRVCLYYLICIKIPEVFKYTQALGAPN